MTVMGGFQYIGKEGAEMFLRGLTVITSLVQNSFIFWNVRNWIANNLKNKSTFWRKKTPWKITRNYSVI